MSQGLLKKCFSGVAAKRLSAVEADLTRSHQHEFNGVGGLKAILGEADRRKIPTTFILLSDEQEGITEEGFLSWYDARRDHPTRSEYRLYFNSTEVSRSVTAGDAVFIAARPDNSLVVIYAREHSTMENQLLWLFDLPALPESGDKAGKKYDIRQIGADSGGQTDFAVRYILDELGLEYEEPETDFLDLMLSRFGGAFPDTMVFSRFARETLPGITPADSPDAALLTWLNQEEVLFRRLERHLVAQRLRAGFINDEEPDVEGFVGYSLSIQNRRKSRAGRALENHLGEIFNQLGIRYERGVITENRQKPDFLFPGQREYQNAAFPAEKLTMLGAKSTCKDRWRQVLVEAARIQKKHLLTLEPGISENQTNEMKRHSLQLILPAELHQTYKPDQQAWLMNLAEFVEVVRGKQVGEGFYEACQCKGTQLQKH